ncbi:MAG: hypothetical protein HY843_00760 [Bdellovibrio sp.]|nr:hypothetical protein [Bdellovibrio sp.]
MNTNKTPQTLLDQLNSKKWIIWGIIILSLVFRLWFSFFTDFSRDEIKIYEKGFSFYKTGHLPITGAEIAYSSTELPGSLQALLTGVPLFLSKGEPWGASLFVAFLNFFAVFLIFAIYIMLFPKINQTMLCLFIFWSPWSYLFTSIWNPSFLPFFSALFFW